MRFYDVNILPYIILACIYVYVYVLIDTTASITRGVLIQKGLPGTFDVLTCRHAYFASRNPNMYLGETCLLSAFFPSGMFSISSDSRNKGTFLTGDNKYHPRVILARDNFQINLPRRSLDMIPGRYYVDVRGDSSVCATCWAAFCRI